MDSGKAFGVSSWAILGKWQAGCSWVGVLDSILTDSA